MDMEQHLTYLGTLLKSGCKLRFRTTLFGKNYFWLTDPQGRWFLEPEGTEGP